MDSLLPKALESVVVLDVQNIACGGRHVALVTKEGEVFSWEEESGGRLGRGVDSDVLHPKLIDAFSNTNIELVACVSHWVPKQVNGPLEGIHVSSITCGP